MIRVLSMLCLQFAYALGHRTHGTEGAPASRFIERHHNDTDEGGSQHKTIEAEAELCHPRRDAAIRIGEAPRHGLNAVRGTGPHADATADAALRLHLCITSLPHPNCIPRTELFTAPAGHTASLIYSRVFFDGISPPSVPLLFLFYLPDCLLILFAASRVLLLSHKKLSASPAALTPRDVRSHVPHRGDHSCDPRRDAPRGENTPWPGRTSARPLQAPLLPHPRPR